MCLAAVGLMGDLCRALSKQVLPFCDEIMVMLLENLGVCNKHVLIYIKKMEYGPWCKKIIDFVQRSQYFSQV